MGNIEKVRLEYVWLDGYTPANLRSKVKVVDFIQEDEPPEWSFDGSSTQQADGENSDCVLKPVRTYPNSLEGGIIVLCEVYLPDGTPHPSNTRAKISEDTEDYWWGFEQEYFLMNRMTEKPLGWPEGGMEGSVDYYPEPQGEYYCGIGANSIQGRDIVELHMEACLKAGLEVTGTNAEVALGQWEYQCFNKNNMKACDDLWISRFLLYRIAEAFNTGIELHPKPYTGDWNGSGCHINFSNKEMRKNGTEEMMTDICEKLGKQHEAHMEIYGEHNDMRLTGLHETQHISKFSYGVSDRGASIRIPVATVDNEYKGYLEDRRPASNVDPYQATQMIRETIRYHHGNKNG